MALDLACSVLYVDDGSRDATWETTGATRRRTMHAPGALRLSRNFGKEAASQRRPRPRRRRRRGGHRRRPAGPARADPRTGRAMARRATTWSTPRAPHARAKAASSVSPPPPSTGVMEQLSDTPLPRDTGDFRLLSRRAVLALRELRERQRFMKGLFAWIGYRQTGVQLPPRAAPRGHQQVELLAPAQPGRGRHHLVLRGAVAPGHLARLRVLPAGLRLRRLGARRRR